jgi:hypothetical protein
MSTGVPGAGGKEPTEAQLPPGQRQAGAQMPAPTGMPAPSQAAGMGQRAVSPKPEARPPAAAAAVGGVRDPAWQKRRNWGIACFVFSCLALGLGGTALATYFKAPRTEELKQLLPYMVAGAAVFGASAIVSGGKTLTWNKELQARVEQAQQLPEDELFQEAEEALEEAHKQLAGTGRTDSAEGAVPVDLKAAEEAPGRGGAAMPAIVRLIMNQAQQIESSSEATNRDKDLARSVREEVSTPASQSAQQQRIGTQPGAYLRFLRTQQQQTG